MLRVTSYGGGVQSTALLVLAAQGKIDYRIFLFCNVGEDSEHPATLTYVHEVAMPYAKTNGIELVELQQTRFGEPETLYQRLMRPDRSVGIPMRMSSGAPGRRSCTADFKIKVVDQWLRSHAPAQAISTLRKELLQFFGIKKIDKKDKALMQRLLLNIDTFFEQHEPVATVGLGISLDELQRMKPNMDEATFYWKVNAFPLITGVPKPLTRQDCINIILKAGLSVPSKSACIFCPFHTLQRWQEMRQHEPEHFWKAAALEEYINQKRENVLAKDKMWLTRKLIPLAQATTELTQDSLFEDESDICESGYCMM